MKLKVTLIFLSTVFLFSGCFLAPETEVYEGSLAWEEIQASAGWSKRYDIAVVDFQDSFYLMGGYSPVRRGEDSYCEDVWNSEDGIEWTEILSDAPWMGRRGHAAVVFDDGDGEAIFLLGGYMRAEDSDGTANRGLMNDVWKSADGVNWTDITPRDSDDIITIPWEKRSEFSVLVFNDKIWIFGGFNQEQYGTEYLDDVWSSPDGVCWTEEGRLPGVMSHGAAALSNDGTAMMIAGGWGDLKGKAYISADGGASWNETGLFSREICQFELSYFEGKFWHFPGASARSRNADYRWGEQNIQYYNGTLWITDSAIGGFGQRHSYKMLKRVVNGTETLYFFGGAGDNLYNDVWTAHMAGDS